MNGLAGRRVVHVTTTDMSLALLLGSQLQAFSAAGLEVIGVSAPGPWVADLSTRGIRHESLRHATRSVAPGHDALALLELTRMFRRLRPDIVHTHNPKPGLYGRLAARLAGVPFIVNTVHGLYASRTDSWAKRAVVYALERTASLCSNAELVQNVEDVETLTAIGIPARKLTLLGNGVDLTRFRPRHDPDEVAHARTQLGVSTEAVVVGVVGRLVWQKGFRELFDAAAWLRTRCPNVVISVVGPEDSDKSDSLRSSDIEAARTLGNVTFAGRRDDVEYLYSGFDLFALPSYREGFPRAAMEAAASGLPVVATDIRGCRQVVAQGETGVLVPVRDSAALAIAVAELVGDAPRRARMGVAARRKAEREFDERTVIDTTLDLYERLVATRARDGARQRGRS